MWYFVVLTRIRNALFAAVLQAIGNETSLGIAYYGGVDSTLLAKISKDIGTDETLLTVGFSRSRDVTFSGEIARKMNMPHKILKLDNERFHEVTKLVSNKIGCNITSHTENCIAFFYIGRLAHDNNIHCVLTANGYDRFRSVYPQGQTAIMDLLDTKLENELVLMGEINRITEEFGVTVKQPFLLPDFISFAKRIPINYKIRGPSDMVRKHILRETASVIGVPAPSVMQRKMALQYSSLIHKEFCKGNKEAQ